MLLQVPPGLAVELDRLPTLLAVGHSLVQVLLVAILLTLLRALKLVELEEVLKALQGPIELALGVQNAVCSLHSILGVGGVDVGRHLERLAGGGGHAGGGAVQAHSARGRRLGPGQAPHLVLKLEI